MRRLSSCGILLFAVFIGSFSVFAQSDKLVGRWEGKSSSAQGERDTTAIFKQEGEVLTGTITGMRGDIQFKEIKVDGNKVAATAEVQTPQSPLLIHYNFVMEGETLNGKGSLDFNGTPFEFNLNLKRAGGQAATPVTQNNGATAARPNAPRPARVSVPQPQQKITIDYFVGEWSFNQKGRDSALGDGVRDGLIVLKKNADGKSVSGTVTGTKETITISFDESTKAFILNQKFTTGAVVNLKGEWTSPIAIRVSSDAVKIKSETIKLRRTINIIAAHSFSLFDELSESDGPFVRLGNAVFSKAETK